MRIAEPPEILSERPLPHAASSSNVRDWAWRLGPPLIAFLFARVRLFQAAHYARIDGLTAQAYSRWDSAHYLSIARSGYEYFSCARLPGYNPAEHCGNAGWLPGFPLLLRALSALHIEPVLAGAIIAAMFALATLILLWNGFLGPQPTAAGLLTLVLAAFFPGHVYEHALFPISVCAFFQLLSLRLYLDSRFLAAGIAGAAAAFSYSSSIFLAGVLGLHLLLCFERPFWRRVGAGIASSGVVALGFVAFLVVLHFQVEHWNAYFLVQAKYKFGVNPPWQVFAKNVHRAFFEAQATQTLFVAGLAITLLWGASRTPRRAVDGLLAIFLLVYWLVPLTLGGQLSIYRAEAVLLPAVPLAAKLPLPVLVVVTLGAVYIASKMDVLFFSGALV
jgi:hypothetical protein